jgi:hypothetical protein
MPLTGEEQKDWDAIGQALRQLKDSFHEFLSYVRQNYLEVDIEKASHDAWLEYIEFEKDFLRRIGHEDEG